jgi:hypothetical protein
LNASLPSTFAEIDVAAFGAMDAGVGIDLPDDPRVSTVAKLIAGNQIGLVEEYDIGEGKLLLRFVSAVDLAQEMPMPKPNLSSASVDAS